MSACILSVCIEIFQYISAFGHCDIDDVILNENTFNIESMNKHSITSEEEKVAINKEKDIKIEEILIDNKELDSILSDIENFEI